MAQSFQIPPGDVEYRNTLRDARGTEVLKFGYREVVTIDPEGQSRVFKESEHVALADGRLFTAATLATGKIELAICDLCRYPLPPRWWWSQPESPSLGCMARESGAFCAGCSLFVCKKHSAVVADGSVRCILCARRFRWRALFRALFFTPIREDA
ncbi:MAG TPA: hypothetical protein PKK06_05505 [Phycisphaerae bacterium]|nr:hypothetical protein [Phycisphaerae bacterium]HNU44786.1 hypothetical protein [Phycisphaerae bacterium]